MTLTRHDAVAPGPGPFPVAQAQVPRVTAHARHAQREWIGSGWVTTWALTGTVLPGTGLIMAGYRKTGFAVLTLSLAAAGASAALLSPQVTGRLPLTNAQLERLAVAAVPVVGSLLALLLVLTTLGLLRSATSDRRAGGWALFAMTLVAAGLVAAGWYARLVLYS